MPVPLPLQSDMVGEASDCDATKFPPFSLMLAVADKFGDEIEVDDNCSFNVFTSFSANVALCKNEEKTNSN